MSRFRQFVVPMLAAWLVMIPVYLLRHGWVLPDPPNGWFAFACVFFSGVLFGCWVLLVWPPGINYREYLVLLDTLGRLRAAGAATEHTEDCLAERMDVVWDRLTRSERKSVENQLWRANRGQRNDGDERPHRLDSASSVRRDQQ